MDPLNNSTEGSDEPSSFKINASYIIAPGNTLEDLGDDIGCLLESGIAALEQEPDAVASAQWAAVYALRQARAVWHAYHEKVSQLRGYEEARHGD